MEEKTKRNGGRRSTIYVIIAVIGFIIFLAIPGFARIVYYNVTVEEMQDEIASYSPDTYEYLLEAANNIFKEEEKVIDLNAKPENILIEVLAKQENTYICTLLLDEEKTNEYYPIPSITVELSEGLEILSTTSDYSSEEKFAQAFRNNIMVGGLDAVITIALMQVIIIFGVFGIIFALSAIFHKKERK